LKRATEASSWINWTIKEKEKYSRILLSPFSIDGKLLKTFIEIVDNDIKTM
jgi:hypothetical protein